MNKQDIAMSSKIYNHLADIESKRIFGQRLLYSLTDDYRWLSEIVRQSKEGQMFLRSISKSDSNREVVMFGVGEWAKELLKIFPEVHYDFFADNNAKQIELPVGGKNRCRVLSFDELCYEHKEAMIVISTRIYNREIYEQLIAAGFPEENIINIGKMNDELYKQQYFDLPYLTHDDNEIFADCGCFDGTTSFLFDKWSKGKYQHIYAFEPDNINYQKCKEALNQKLHSVSLFNCGVWEKKEKIYFEEGKGSASETIAYGEKQIFAEALDDILEGKGATFIKMDIEGSELKALQGCRKTIMKYKPKLAVCVYHKSEDIWEIPQFLLDLNSDYKFYLRHYSLGHWETVLYAI